MDAPADQKAQAIKQDPLPALHAGVVPFQPQIHDAGFGLAYADFVPVCLFKGGFMKRAEFERFGLLAARANEWLKQNPNVKVKTCESVESQVQYGREVPDTQTSMIFESSNMGTEFNRSLRVWFLPKEASDPAEPDQIGYYNVVPASVNPGGISKKPEFEPFNVTIDKINQHFMQQPLNGKIINLETQDMRFEEYDKTIDPDNCYWYERGDLGNFFMMIIRIFYKVGPPAMETIGVVDFVPARTEHSTSVFTQDSFEQLQTVADRATQWIQQQQDLKVTNVQSIDYKVSGKWEGGPVDTMRSLFYEYGTGFTRYLRIIRVYHTKSFNQDPPSYRPFTLSYRTFLPALTKYGGMFSSPQFEQQPKTLERAQAWVKLTGAKVVSVESVPLRMFQKEGIINPEDTYTYNYGYNTSVICLRVYFDGVYNDPAPEALPPLPAIAPASSGDCCICCVIQ